MKYEIIDSPDFGMLKVTFEQPGEQIVSESGAMVGMSTGIKMETSMRGGLLAAAKRKMMGGESLFQNTYTASEAGQTIYFSPAPEGDLRMLELGAGETFFLQSGNYVAHTGESMELDTKWGGGKGFFSGMGMFMLKIVGPGTVFFNSYGAIHEVDVGNAGYICDTSHIVGFSDGLSYDIRKFGGFKGLFFSGEGLVCHFSGSGKLYMQTRNAPGLAAFLEPFRPVETKSN